MTLSEFFLEAAGLNSKTPISFKIFVVLGFAFMIYVLPGIISRICKNKRIDDWIRNYMRDEKSNLPFQKPCLKGLFLSLILGIFGLLFMLLSVFLVVGFLFFLRDLKVF
jgi:hypothetical protein